MEEATEICVTGPQWLGDTYGKVLHPERFKFGNETPVVPWDQPWGFWKDPKPLMPFPEVFKNHTSFRKAQISHNHEA
jgi:hypothetical protein